MFRLGRFSTRPADGDQLHFALLFFSPSLFTRCETLPSVTNYRIARGSYTRPGPHGRPADRNIRWISFREHPKLERFISSWNNGSCEWNIMRTRGRWGTKKKKKKRKKKEWKRQRRERRRTRRKSSADGEVERESEKNWRNSDGGGGGISSGCQTKVDSRATSNFVETTRARRDSFLVLFFSSGKKPIRRCWA